MAAAPVNPTPATPAPSATPTPVATGTWVDDGKGTDYPAGTDGKHSGDFESLEERFDRLAKVLAEKHGITF